MSETVTKSQITADLKNNLGVRPGNRIIVHSSMKSLGQVEGGPTAVIEALIDAVGGGEAGTVLMPCFTNPLEVCDVINTPCRLGLVPETFRTFPGVRLSRHHTHRAAVFGRDADAIAAAHDHSTALGNGSPFHEMAKRGAFVIHIGCDFRSSSLIHVAEHIFPTPFGGMLFPYPGYEKTMTLICQDGSRQLRPPREVPGDSAGYLAVQAEMDRYGLILHGQVAQAKSMKIRGLDMLAVAMELLSRDPASLLCKKPSCTVCAGKHKVVAEWKSRQSQAM